MKYTIYHILGVKVGCTKDLSKRTTENKRFYGEDIEIKVVAEFGDINKATDYEIYLNRQFGYKQDSRRYDDVKDMHKTRTYKPISEEQKEKIRKSMLGKNTGERSQETKDKIGQATKNRPVYECPHCGKQCKGQGNLKQHIKAKHL